LKLRLKYFWRAAPAAPVYSHETDDETDDRHKPWREFSRPTNTTKNEERRGQRRNKKKQQKNKKKRKSWRRNVNRALHAVASIEQTKRSQPCRRKTTRSSSSTSLETPTPPYYYSPAPSPYQQIHTESIGRQHEGRMQSRTLNNMNAPIGLNPVSLQVGASSVWLIVSAAVIACLCLDCDSICDST